jgi:DNA-binding NarL/FixJ family response regulator
MATEPVTSKRNSPRVALISDSGELEQRIAMILPEASLEVELSDTPGLDDSEHEAPAAVVAAVSGTATSTAASIKTLRRRIRDVPLVVVIPSTRSQPEARAAISAGADGAVIERDIETTLAATVAVAASGQVAFPDTLLKAPKQPSFTRREKQALGMMVLGFTNQEIGATLGLAETTIKSHLCSAFEELGVSSRAEASALILDAANGLGLDVLAIEPDEDPGDRN